MNKKTLKTAIILCWVALVVCLIIKLLGGNWFIIATDNQVIIDICNFIDKTFLKYILFYITNLVSSSIYYMAVLQDTKLNLKWLIPLAIYGIVKIIFNQFDILFFILDFVMIIGLPIIVNPKKWLASIIGCVLMLAFQGLSQILKLNNYTMFDENTLMTIILSIDYYIMLILYLLYRIREGGE